MTHFLTSLKYFVYTKYYDKLQKERCSLYNILYILNTMTKYKKNDVEQWVQILLVFYLYLIYNSKFEFHISTFMIKIKLLILVSKKTKSLWLMG